MQYIVKLTVAFAIMLALHPTLDAQTELRWKWKKGQHLEVSLEQNTRTTTTVNKRPIQMTIASKMDATWSVLNVDSDGGATIEQSVKRMTLSLKTPEKPALEYDSNEKRHPSAVRPTAEAVEPLLNLPIRIDITATGRITAVHLDERAEEALKKSGAGLRVPALFTKAGFTSVVQQTAPVLPEKKVAEGDSWTSQREFDSAFGRMGQATKYELAGTKTALDGPQRQIKVTGELKVLQAKQDARGELKSQTLTGELHFDEAAGLLRESTITQQLSTERMYRGKTITVESLSTLIMVLRETETP